MSKEKGKRKKKNENYSLLRGSSRVMQTALKHPVSAIHTLTEFLPSLRSHSENMPRAGPATRTRQGQAVLTQVCGQSLDSEQRRQAWDQASRKFCGTRQQKRLWAARLKPPRRTVRAAQPPGAGVGEGHGANSKSLCLSEFQLFNVSDESCTRQHFFYQ